jgi:uncharacterized protein (DUF2236 family)
MSLSRRTRQEIRKIMLKFSPSTTKIHLGKVQVRILRSLLYQVLKAAIGMKDEEEAKRLLSLLHTIESTVDVLNVSPRPTENGQ